MAHADDTQARAEALARRAVAGGKGKRRNPAVTDQDVSNLASDLEHELLMGDPTVAPSKARPDDWTKARR